MALKGDGMAIIAIFVGAIIATVLLASIADDVTAQRNTIEITNISVTLDATTNVTVDLEGRELLTLLELYNTSTTTGACPSCTVATTVSTSSGLLSVTITTNDTGVQGTAYNVSYTANPDGYLSEGTSRNVINLVVLFGALAIFVFVIVVLFATGSLGRIIRGFK